MWLCAVYADGRVCISILHSPGDDPHGYEQASERWLPIHTVRFPVMVVWYMEFTSFEGFGTAVVLPELIAMPYSFSIVAGII